MQNQFIVFRNLGLEHWLTTFNKMNNFNIERNFYTLDEIWFVEHYPIFTQGRYKKENIIFVKDIAIVNTNRGGQITYHAPGQQILYFLIDLKRRKINIRELIDIMQKIIVETLKNFSITAYIQKQLPGVYVNKKKICSLGLRVKNGFTSHGLALNIDMDLTPFSYINPCGHANMRMTQVKNFNVNIKLKEVRIVLTEKLSDFFKVIMIKGK